MKDRLLLDTNTGDIQFHVGIWEIVLKHQAGKLRFQGLWEELLDQILFRAPWDSLPLRPN